MSFEIDGFFSPEIEAFCNDVRSRGATKQWFDYALDLNRIGFDLLRDAQSDRSDNALFTMHGLFVRTHQSFQAALVLAERGLVGDARTVLRSGVEGAIAICALAADPAFVERLIEAHYYNQRKVARLVLSNPEYHSPYGPAELAAMQRVKDEVDAMEVARKRKLQDINWADAAQKHCRDLYNLLYRSLSSDGTHTTLNSLDRYVCADANMKITAFKVAPDGEGLVEVLSAACLLFLWAADPFAAAVSRPDVTQQLKEQLQRFRTLPGAFPHETSAAA